ncbi:hypothetical protein EDB92DRAFT_1878051 [Lactarius akahatsu]|uniref:Uncharacterized protein n=1 Tax=Lactarius akahatsu TaxID=416441 RepID=A0AAD4Q8J4_9AGAM|nr:hypothetical protein EDB92DRAFT_1878051 [Lactarius akahatsu]
MVFPDPYPTPPETYAFSPSPDAPKEDDSIAQWDQLAGYAQPEPVEGINFDFEGLDVLLAWELGDTLPEPTPASQLGGGLVSIFIPTMEELTNICHRISTGAPNYTHPPPTRQQPHSSFHHRLPPSRTSISPTSSSRDKPPLGSSGTASTLLSRRSHCYASFPDPDEHLREYVSILRTTSIRRRPSMCHR